MNTLHARIRSHKLVLATGAAALALTACGGGGGGTSTPAAPTTAPSSGTPSGYLTPQFRIVVPAPSSSSRARRTPQFVSTATQSITITITNPPVGLAPTSATTNISGASCSSGCTVNGPASPPGVVDDFVLTTFDAANGAGNALDTATTMLTPIAGQANTGTVTLLGIPSIIIINGVPTNFHAGTPGQTAPLTVVVEDHAGQAITGTYANPVTITDPDLNPGPNATFISGTNACGVGCVRLTGSSDTIQFNYGGLAENPVTLISSAAGVSGPSAGTATFTPVLQPIVYFSGPHSAFPGNPVGIDLFTTDPFAMLGFTGQELYTELGFTNAPYGGVLSLQSAAGCAIFATMNTLPTAPTTTFIATAIPSAIAGFCSLTVTDGLTDQMNPLPTFVVTYTTASAVGNGKQRHP
jgi:hypothetical protein